MPREGRRARRRHQGVRAGEDSCAPGDRPDDRLRRVRLADRPVGLREVDAASHHRRPRRADERQGDGERQVRAAGPERPRLRDRLPARGALRLAHRHEEHRAAARDARLDPGSAQRPDQGDARARRAHRVREPLSVAALGRDAAARLDRSRLVVLAAAAPDGRAVRSARRDDPRAPEHGAARHLAGDRLDHDLRHALDRRGGVPLDARRRDVPAARAGSRRSSRSTCRSRGRPRRARTRASSSS